MGNGGWGCDLGWMARNPNDLFVEIACFGNRAVFVQGISWPGYAPMLVVVSFAISALGPAANPATDPPANRSTVDLTDPSSRPLWLAHPAVGEASFDCQSVSASFILFLDTSSHF